MNVELFFFTKTQDKNTSSEDDFGYIFYRLSESKSCVLSGVCDFVVFPVAERGRQTQREVTSCK